MAYRKSFLMGVVIFITWSSTVSFSQSDIGQVRLNPEQPTTEDNVTLELIVGQHSNSCIPKFSESYTTDSVLVYCVAPPCPIPYSITLSYESRPVENDPERICLDVMTSYGPQWDFGKLNPGEYRILFEQDTIARFTVIDVRDHHQVGNRENPAGRIRKETGPTVFLNNNELKLRLTDSERISVDILTAGGKVIESPICDSYIEAGVHSLGKLSSFPSGVYFMQVKTKGDIVHKQFIIGLK